jgi:hypothetical protein
VPPIAQAFVRIRPDDTGFKRDADTKIKSSTRGLGAKIPITADTAPSQRAIDDLQVRLGKLAAKTYTAGIGINDKDTTARLAKIALTLDKLNRTVAEPSVKISGIARAEADLLALDAQFDKITGSTRTLDSSLAATAPGFVNLAAAGIALGPAILPVLATATASAVGLGVALGPPLALLGGLGALAANQITQMKKDAAAIEALAKSADAATGKTRQKDMAKLALLNKQFAASYGPAADALDNLQRKWKQFKAADSGALNSTIAQTFNLIAADLPRLDPLLATATTGADKLIHVFAGFSSSGGLQHLVTFIDNQARPAFDGFELDMHNLGHAASVLAPELSALGTRADAGLTQMIARFAAFAASRGPGALDALMHTLQTEGPQVGHLITALAQDIPALTHGLTPLAPVSLALATSLARLVANVPPGVITAIAIGFVAWAAGAKALMAKDALGNAWQTVAKFAGAATAAAVAEGAAAAGADAMTVSEIAAAAATRGLTIALDSLPVIGIIAGLTTIAGLFLATRNSGETLTDSLARQDKAIGFNIAGYQKLARQTADTGALSQRLATQMNTEGTAMTRVRDGGGAASVALGQVAAAHLRASSTATNLLGALSTLQGMYGLSRQNTEKLAVAAGVSATQLSAQGRAGQNAFSKITTYADGVGQATVRSLQMHTATDGLNTALQRLSNGLLTDQGNLIAWRQAQQQATTAIGSSATALKGNSSAALEARQAVLQSTQAAIQLATSERNTHDGVQKATAVIRDQIGWLQQHAGKSKFARQEVDALRQALAKIKSESATITVKASGAFTVERAGSGPGIKSFSGGGHLSGYGGGDQIPILAEAGETIVDKDSSRQPFMVAAFKAAGVPGYAAGGVAGNYKGNPKGLGSFLVTEDTAALGVLEKLTAAAAAKALKSLQASAGFGGIGGGGSGTNVQIGKRMAASIGWTGLDWDYLDSGWQEESGWNQHAQNPAGTPYTAAYGIPQSNPGSKMAAAGPDWLNDPATQIRWGLGYIRGTYGAPTKVPLWSAHGPLPGYQGYAAGGIVTHDPSGQRSMAAAFRAAGAGGYAAGGRVGGPPKTPQPARPGQSRLQRDQAELDAAVKKLAAERKTAAAHISVMRRPIDREELFLLDHPGLSAARKKALRDKITKQEAAVTKYRDGQVKSESTLQRRIALLRKLVASDPHPRKRPPGRPDPVDLGTKKQRLAELARIVASEKALKAAAKKKIAAMRVPLQKEELQLLLHPGSPQNKRALEADITRREKAIAKYRKQVGAEEDKDDREIELLRALTGNPPGAKYGGAPPAPPADGGGSGGDTGGGSGSGGGAAGPPAGPIPAFLAPFAPNPPDTAAGGAFGQAPGGAGQLTFGAGGSGSLLGGTAPAGFSGGGGQLLGPPPGSPQLRGGGSSSPFAGPAGGTLPLGGGEQTETILRRILAEQRQTTAATRRAPALTATGTGQVLNGVANTARIQGAYATR